NRTQEERKQNAEDKLVRNLLYAKKININELREYVPVLDKNYSYRLILIHNSNKKLREKSNNQNNTLLQKAILLRSILHENDFFPAISVGNNEIAIIAFFDKDKTLDFEKNNFLKVINSITSTNEENIFEGTNCLLGVSSQNESLSLINESYKE